MKFILLNLSYVGPLLSGYGLLGVFPRMLNASKTVCMPATTDCILRNWEASLHGGHSKAPTLQVWVPPRDGEFKVNVDGAAGGKPGLAGIGGVLQNTLGVVVALFSMHVGIMESNEEKAQVILEAP